MRKILRNIARNNMKLAGIQRMNKKARWSDSNGHHVDGSFFALNWRNYLQPKRKGRRAA